MPFVASRTVNLNYNPSFTLYSTTGYTDPGTTDGDGRGFDQTGTSAALSANPDAVTQRLDCKRETRQQPSRRGPPYRWRHLVDQLQTSQGGVTNFVGYANSGAIGWHHDVGHLIGMGGVGAGYSGSTVAGMGIIGRRREKATA